MTKQINNVDKLIKYISESSEPMTNNQREELRDVIGIGHGYTSGGVIGRSGRDE